MYRIKIYRLISMALYTNFIRLTSLFLITALVVAGCNQPEPEEPDPIRRKSPIAIAKINHEASDTYIKIVYGQPYKREREIFGNVVPYGEVWRTGANEATELTTTKDIRFGGERLQAGTYSLFSVPREDENWTIILNSQLGQWGAFDYDQEFDVLRVEVPSRTIDPVAEAFTIQFDEASGDSTNIVMRWDNTEVKIPVEFISDEATASP